MSKPLKDYLPDGFLSGSFDDDRAFKFKDVIVVKVGDDVEVPSHLRLSWPGREKFVFNWYVLSNGYAVGFNENPSRGWGFPVIKYKNKGE